MKNMKKLQDNSYLESTNSKMLIEQDLLTKMTWLNGISYKTQLLLKMNNKLNS